MLSSQSPKTKSPPQKSVKDIPILQKVLFTSTSEIQQRRKTSQESQKSIQELQKCPSSPAFSIQVDSIKSEPAREQKFTPSITSIGNAVLRSKTADFERITKTDAKTKTTTTTTTTTTEKKKYTKRRYTDSRHQTRHIPDSEALEATSSSQVKKEERITVVQAPVYKRRELISSVPSK